MVCQIPLSFLMESSRKESRFLNVLLESSLYLTTFVYLDVKKAAHENRASVCKAHILMFGAIPKLPLSQMVPLKTITMYSYFSYSMYSKVSFFKTFLMIEGTCLSNVQSAIGSVQDRVSVWGQILAN